MVFGVLMLKKFTVIKIKEREFCYNVNEDTCCRLRACFTYFQAFIEFFSLPFSSWQSLDGFDFELRTGLLCAVSSNEGLQNSVRAFFEKMLQYLHFSPSKGILIYSDLPSTKTMLLHLDLINSDFFLLFSS